MYSTILYYTLLLFFLIYSPFGQSKQTLIETQRKIKDKKEKEKKEEEKEIIKKKEERGRDPLSGQGKTEEIKNERERKRKRREGERDPYCLTCSVFTHSPP